MSENFSEGGDAVEDVAAEGAVDEGEATEVAAPVVDEPTVDPLELQAELEHVRTQNQELFGILNQFSQQAEPGQFAQDVQQSTGVDVAALTDEYGNFNPNAFAQYQAQRDQQLLGQIGQMFQPIQQTFASQQEASVIAEGEQRLSDILADDVSRNGEFASDPSADAQARELVNTLASQKFPDIAARWGNGPQAAERAMTEAAAEVRGLLRSVGGAAVSQNQNQLATLAGQHGEPGAGGAGVEAPVIRMGDTSASRFATGGSN